MSDKNIYQILESLDAAQRGVKQLPALFKPRDTSPQLSGPYPGRNATLGYLVGEGDETGWGSETGDSGADETPDGVSPDTQSFLDEEQESNPMAQAVTRRIVNQHPEWITRYGVELLMQVIDDVTEDETDWEEIGSSDVSAFVNMVGDQLRDRGGSREEMRDRRPFAAKGVAEDGQRYKFQRIKFRGTNHDIGEERYRFVIDGDVIFFNFPSDEDRPDPDSPSFEEILARVQSSGEVRHYRITPAEQQAIAKKIAAERQRYLDQRRQGVAESKNTTEDVISTVKKKLGDYLSDLSKEIKSDPDLKDKLERDIDQIKSVKTIRTDDGHEIKITGNEDDGFRITIKNREMKTPFKSLDEAVMATEMYCARRKKNKDYLEEQ